MSERVSDVWVSEFKNSFIGIMTFVLLQSGISEAYYMINNKEIERSKPYISLNIEA